MHSRLVAATFGFLVVLGAFELAFLVMGTPRAVGPVIALVLSTLILLDPGQLLSEPPRRAD
jgi:hypothetical protein